jgi:hypothetical protein
MSRPLQSQRPYRNIKQQNDYEPTSALMRREVSLFLAVLLFIASIALLDLALSKHSYGGLAAAAVLLIISLAWWWENWRA